MSVPIAPLFVPGDRPERFEKAAASQADAIIIDLEDAVSEGKKHTARENFASHGINTKPVIVRINARDTAHWAADLEMLARVQPKFVMVPKAENLSDLGAVARAAGDNAKLIPLVETALGIEESRLICGHHKVAWVAFGALDYALDIGVTQNCDIALNTARALLVMRARAAKCAAPLDGVTTVIDDASIVAADAAAAADLGFGGKLAIHPAQVEAIKSAFSPSVEQIKHALSVVAGLSDNGAAVVDGAMVDAPVIKQAQKLLERASSQVLAAAKIGSEETNG